MISSYGKELNQKGEKRLMEYFREVQEDFDKLAHFPSMRWNTNTHYYQHLLRNVDDNCDRILEVGCGKGEFCKKLLIKSSTVLGIDLSPNMITRAKQENQISTRIFFEQGDYMRKKYPDEYFDCIVSIATVHHIPLSQFLTKAKKELKPGGKLIILDLYQLRTIADHLLGFLSLPLKKLLSIYYNQTLTTNKNERRVWKEHGEKDNYMTLSKLKGTLNTELPGCKVRRLIFWRYSAIWAKNP